MATRSETPVVPFGNGAAAAEAADAPLPQEPDPRPAVQAMRDLLGAELTVTISDGRVVRGKFSCLDQAKNLILLNAAEIKPDGQYGVTLGNTLVPGKHVVKVEKEGAPVEAPFTVVEGAGKHP